MAFNETLSSTNYLTWSLQIQYLLEGYDLHHFIDGTHILPPPTITVIGVTSPNSTYVTWKCQNRLILALSLVLSLFHYNRLLSAPPFPLMHDKA